MDIKPLETAEGYDVPTVRQQSIFVENQVGQLLRLTRLFDRADIRILALSVVYSVDCAICRMILDDPDSAYDVMTNSRFQVSDSELIVVSVPHGKRALLGIWTALLSGEISIHYTYALLVRPKGAAAIAVVPDNLEQAVPILRESGFELLTQQDLLDTRYS